MQPFSPQDLFLHRDIADVACCATSGAAAFTVHAIDADGDSVRSCIWLAALDGSKVSQLTRGPGQDQSPCWSPRGDRLAFLSNRSGSMQAWVIDLAGGEARQVGDAPAGTMNLRWSPDGATLLVTRAVVVDPELRGARADRPAPIRSASAPEIAWRLPYKSDGVGYLLQREIHLFAVDVASGAASQVTDGPFDILGYDVSPDGRHIAYSRTRDGRFAHGSDLWVCDIDGSRARRLTDSHAMVIQPAWSTDGAWIAFSGAEVEGDAQARLWAADAASGEVRRLGGNSLEVADGESVRWQADGRVVFVRAHRGRHQVASIGFGDAESEALLAGDRQFGVFAATDDAFVFSVEHPALPTELWTVARNGGDERCLTDLNAWWRERPAITAETMTFDVPDGRGGREAIDGWLIACEGTPAGAPLVDHVHGGPASYNPVAFGTNLFRHVLCSRGWRVLLLDAVGSSSYGTAFCRRLLGHWGEYDMPQHLAAIERLQDRGLAGDDLALVGGSYGGYLTAWTIGHDHRFASAVVMAPVGNIETHYGTSDGGYYSDPYYLSTDPHFDRELARALSPLQHIERARTPTLFLQGKDDERCPKCQSEELFVSLMRAGDTPTELVLYPNEGHTFLSGGAPSCRVDAATRIVDWLESHRTAGPARAHDRDAVAERAAPRRPAPMEPERVEDAATAQDGSRQSIDKAATARHR